MEMNEIGAMVKMNGEKMTYGGDVGVWKVVFWVAEQQGRLSHPWVPNQEHLHYDDDDDDGDLDDEHEHDGENCLEEIVKLLLRQHSPAFHQKNQCTAAKTKPEVGDSVGLGGQQQYLQEQQRLKHSLSPKIWELLLLLLIRLPKSQKKENIVHQPDDQSAV